MTKIRVATEISLPAERFDSLDPRHGIYNVIEGVLKEICKRDDLDVTAVGLCGQDPLSTSIRSELYLEQSSPLLTCSFAPSFKVGFGLTRLYQRLFHQTLSASFDDISRSTKLARSVLYRMAFTYGLCSPEWDFDPNRYDVFHCPQPDLPAKEITGDLPRVVTIYDIIPVSRPDFVPRDVAAKFKDALSRIEHSDWAVCISEFTRQEFCHYTGMPPERCVVAPLAADEMFRPIEDDEAIAAMRSRYALPKGNYLLSLAAPQPRKNLAHLIRSFFRLLEEQRLSETYLVLAGSKEQGWMYDEIFAAAEAGAENRSRVIFTGYVRDEDLPALLSNATAFVFPSLYEGFGLPALEAMACGTAVITSNTTSLPEVVGDAGLMVDPTSSDDLCAAILTLIENDSLRQDLEQKGKARAARFSWKRCADQTARAYHLAARSSRKGG